MELLLACVEEVGVAGCQLGNVLESECELLAYEIVALGSALLIGDGGLILRLSAESREPRGLDLLVDPVSVCRLSSSAWLRWMRAFALLVRV